MFQRTNITQISLLKIKKYRIKSNNVFKFVKKEESVKKSKDREKEFLNSNTNQ